MARPRSSPDPTEGPVRGEALDFIDLIKKIPPSSRPHLLEEEKARLEANLVKINKMLKGEDPDE